MSLDFMRSTNDGFNTITIPNGVKCTNTDCLCTSHANVVQEFYAQKGPFTKQIATEGFSTVSGQLISPL